MYKNTLKFPILPFMAMAIAHIRCFNKIKEIVIIRDTVFIKHFDILLRDLKCGIFILGFIKQLE